MQFCRVFIEKNADFYGAEGNLFFFFSSIETQALLAVPAGARAGYFSLNSQVIPCQADKVVQPGPIGPSSPVFHIIPWHPDIRMNRNLRRHYLNNHH